MKEVGLYIKEGWKEPIMYYQFICSIHGKVINYPHGHNNRLECPICFKDVVKDK